VNITYFIIIFAFVFVLALWVAVSFRHLKTSKRTLANKWEFVDEQIRKRHDLLPLLIETYNRNIESSGELAGHVKELISVRDSARVVYFAGKEKSDREEDLVAALERFLGYGGKSEELGRDQVYLEIKGELGELGSDIENRSKEYNEYALKFNSHMDFVLLKPMASLFRFGKAKVFGEVEVL